MKVLDTNPCSSFLSSCLPEDTDNIFCELNVALIWMTRSHFSSYRWRIFYFPLHSAWRHLVCVWTKKNAYSNGKKRDAAARVWSRSEYLFQAEFTSALSSIILHHSHWNEVGVWTTTPHNCHYTVTSRLKNEVWLQFLDSVLWGFSTFRWCLESVFHFVS